MSCNRFAAVVAAGALAAAPLGLSAQAFEGVVTYKMNPGSTRPGTMVYQVKGTKVRADISNLQGGPPGGMYVLIDASVGKMTSVMPAQKMYMTVDLKAMGEQMKQRDSAKPRAGKITETGKTESIAGHKCEHYLIGERQDTDVCAAKGLGVYMGGGAGGGRGMFASLPGGEAYEQFSKDGFLPLKVTSLKSGKEEVVMEAMSVEKKKLDEARFAVPAGYTEVDMGKMMQQRQKPSGS
jgi:hypothetical protein